MRHTMSWLLALLACAALGCTHLRRVDDGEVVNGVRGRAAPVPGGVVNLDRSEVVAVYEGTSLQAPAVARPDTTATLSFFHMEKVSDESSSSGGCGLGGCGGSGPCTSPPKLTIAKLAEYDGRIAPKIDIDVSDLPGEQRDAVPVAFHFEVRNRSCGKATEILLADSLPRGFVPQQVELEDLERLQGPVVFSAFFPLIIPGIVLVATHHGANMEFDDLAYDVKQVGNRQMLVVKVDAKQHPLEQDDYFGVKVSGYVPVPRGAP